jgi:hypothetical protein
VTFHRKYAAKSYFTANCRRGVAIVSRFAYCARHSELKTEDQFDEAYEYSCSSHSELRNRRTGAGFPSLPTDIRIHASEEIEEVAAQPAR